jgi:glycosyltransferase involved in cell wall biosynthesis
LRILTVNAVPDASERAFYTALPTFGDSVDLVVSKRDPNINFYREKGLRVHTLEIKSRLDFKAAKQIRKIIDQNNIEVIYAPDNKSLAASLLAGRGRKVKYATYRGTQGNLSLWNPAVLLTHRNPRVNAIICNCAAVRRYLDTLGINQRKLFTILKGHNPAWYSPKSKLNRSDFNLSETDFVVGLVANLRPLKGVNILFGAIQQLRNRMPIKCLLVGDYDPEYLESLFKKYPIQELVQVLGYRKDAPEIITLCNITAVPSLRREGVPRSMIESMANGVPVIGTSVGGIPEVTEDKVSGLIVPPGDIPALSNAIESLYKDPETLKSYGVHAAERVKTLLNLDNYVESMRNVLQHALNS